MVIAPVLLRLMMIVMMFLMTTRSCSISSTETNKIFDFHGYAWSWSDLVDIRGSRGTLLGTRKSAYTSFVAVRGDGVYENASGSFVSRLGARVPTSTTSSGGLCWRICKNLGWTSAGAQPPTGSQRGSAEAFGLMC